MRAESAAELGAAADRGRIPAFQGSTAQQGPRRLSLVLGGGGRMGTVDRQRLAVLESRVGKQLSADLLAVLNEREPICEGSVALVTPDRIWDVRTSFTLDGRDEEAQLDRVYELVGDVLPPGALPVAEDWGGNFYCLMLSGPLAGRVTYWDHERDEGDHRVEPVAGSVAEFFAGLVPDPREADA